MNALSSTPQRARSKSVSDASSVNAASTTEEVDSALLFPSSSVGHFARLGTLSSGDEDEESGVPPLSSSARLEHGEVRPLLPVSDPNPTTVPLFPFDHFDDSLSASFHSHSRNNSGISADFNRDSQCAIPVGGADGSLASSIQQTSFGQRQRSRRRLMQQQQHQRSSASASAPSTTSSSSAQASSESAAAAPEKVMGPSLRASLDAGMLAMRNWIRSHKRGATSSAGFDYRPATPSADRRANDAEGNNGDESDDDLFPTIFEVEESSPQTPRYSNIEESASHRTVRQRTRSEPDSAGLHEYFLHSSVRRRRRRASTVDERHSPHQSGGGTALFGTPTRPSLLATPPRTTRASHLSPAPSRLSGERLSSSAAAVLSWNSATPGRSSRASSAESQHPRQRQPSLDAQQMLLLLTPTPSTDDHPLMIDENDDGMLASQGFDAVDISLGPPDAGMGTSAAMATLPTAYAQGSSRSIAPSTAPPSDVQPQLPFGSGEPERPQTPLADDRDREARLRWVRINRRFQIVITAVALMFSVVLFAILLCWVVLTSTYVVSLDKPCDVNLKAYFWLVSLQLVMDVFRSDILRFIFRWDSNSSDRVPCRVIAYNMMYLVYALLVLRLGIMSVYVGDPTCKSTAPELFKASTAFVSLSLAAWGIILFGYVVPLFVVAALLTYNGYNPTNATDDARPTGSGPTPVFPAAYSMNGAPPSCIEQLERVPVDAVRGQDCCICMEDFDDKDDAVVRTPCSHCFHKQCCREWLRQARTCPVCRADIPSALPNLDASTNASSTYSEGLASGGEPPSRIPLGPTGRPVRGLFLRVFRRNDSSNSNSGTASPPQSTSSLSNHSSRGGIVAVAGGGASTRSAVDVEMGVSSTATSPRARY